MGEGVSGGGVSGGRELVEGGSYWWEIVSRGDS